jgi:hypothetical protein
VGRREKWLYFSYTHTTRGRPLGAVALRPVHLQALYQAVESRVGGAALARRCAFGAGAYAASAAISATSGA